MKYCDACRTPYPADHSTCPKDQTALREANPKAAEEAFEPVPVLDPNNPRAQEALKRLREHAPPPR